MADPLTIGLAVGGTLLSAWGQVQAGNAAEQAGRNAQVAADYQASQLERNAGQERAMAQRKAIEEARKKRMAQSRAQALVAAQGGGSLDPSVVDLMGDLEAEGQYNFDMALQQGEESARDMETGAQLKRYEGRQALAAGKAEKRSATIAAAGSLLKGGSSIYGDYKASKTLLEKYG